MDFANNFRGIAGKKSKSQKLMGVRFLHLAMSTYRHRIFNKSRAYDEGVVEIYKKQLPLHYFFLSFRFDVRFGGGTPSAKMENGRQRMKSTCTSISPER